MKICYIANVRLPTEKAHGIQIMKTCEAFALLGHEIELIVPTRKNTISADPFEYYEITPEARKRITIKYVKVPDLIRFGRIGFTIQTLWFSESASIEMRKNYPDVVYSRDSIVLFNMFLIHKHLVFEAHRGETSFHVKLVLKKAKLVAISWGLADFYSKYARSCIIAPDGVDLEQFAIPEDREAAKKLVGFPKEKKVALYWGHLYDWKGAQYLAEAAHMFTNYEVAVFVGGTDVHVEQFKSKYGHNPHVQILGRRMHEQAPYFMKAADVLVLPNSAKEKISSHFTSPLKLFEYMASGTPIVAADLPSLREILSEKTALFFTPDNPESLLSAVKKVFNENHNEMAAAARLDVEHYSWNKRAQKIATFINPHIKDAMGKDGEVEETSHKYNE
jgi:glycosyltransferase involved in cell wall biosynthesis